MCVCLGAGETRKQEIVWTNSVYTVHFPLPFPFFFFFFPHSVPPQLLLGGNAVTILEKECEHTLGMVGRKERPCLSWP